MNIYYAVPGEPVPLGKRWEHHATQIIFDISEWAETFGAGSVRLLHQRQDDAAPYPVTITRTDADGVTVNNQTGTLVLWDVTRTDTAQVCHYGRAELRYYAGNEGAEEFLIKSDIYKTSVSDTLGGALADAPEEERNWLDTLLINVDNVSSKSAAADAAATAAQSFADAAAQSATDAADDANTADAAAIAARSAQGEAEAARIAIEDLSVSATSAPAGDAVSVTKSVDEETGAVSLLFSFPQSASAAVPFSNAEAVTLTDGGYVAVLQASYVRAIGDNIELHAEISVTVTTNTSGSDAGGWNLVEAVITAQCVADGTAQSRRPAWTLHDGNHVLQAQYHFPVPAGTSGTHSISLQLQITGGSATVTANAAVMFVSGIPESE